MRVQNLISENIASTTKKRRHSTEEYRAVKKLIAAGGKTKKGSNPKAETPPPDEQKEEQTPKRKKRDRTPEEGDSPPPARKERIDLIFAELDLGGRTERSVSTPPPAPQNKNTRFPLRLLKFCRNATEHLSLKRIDFIMGGSQLCNDSINSIKTHQRKADSYTKGKSPMMGPDHQIAFWESETTDLDKPHDDALVIQIDVGNYELSRIMIDTGGSVDVHFYDAFKKIGHLDSELQGSKTPLTGFAGDTTFSLGTIQLPTVARGVRQLTNFLVVDKKAPFNAIVGRPWLHVMKAVPSTYHQCIKFPSDKGIAVVYGSQRSSPKYYMGGYKYIKKADPIVLMIKDKLAEMKTVRSSDPSQRGPRKSWITQVCIDESDPKRCVGIGHDLDPELREDLITFHQENKDSFAWSSANLRGISLEVTSHELNVDPTYRPIKQKHRKLGPERAKAVNNEVDRLLKIRSIREVKYPD